MWDIILLYSHYSILNDYMTWYLIHRTIDNLGSDFQYAQLILTSKTSGLLLILNLPSAFKHWWQRLRWCYTRILLLACTIHIFCPVFHRHFLPYSIAWSRFLKYMYKYFLYLWTVLLCVKFRLICIMYYVFKIWRQLFQCLHMKHYWTL